MSEQNPSPAEITLGAVEDITNKGASCNCGNPAKWIWPIVSHKPGAYCDKCLSDAKHRLLVALGAASAR